MTKNKFKFLIPFLLISFYVLLNINVKAQLDPPQINCARVMADGSVEINWTAPSDPANEFFNYEIFYSEGETGVFTSFGDYGPISNTTYTHSVSNADVTVYSYYIITKYGLGGMNESSPSDTISTMVLNSNGSSVAELSWEPQFQPSNSGGAADFYKIYKEYPAGNWQLIDQVPYGVNTYNDTVYSICFVEEPIKYKIEVENSLGCISRSSVDSSKYRDLLGPEKVIVETISVDPVTGEAIIYWYPSNAPDIDHYLVQHVQGSINTNVSNQNASDPTEFVYQGSNPGQGIINLVVIAFDSCDNDNSYENIYQTIFLESELFLCDKEAEISWNAYNGWPEGVQEYRVHASENGGPENLIATLGGDATEYLHTELILGSDYCYRIEAVSNGSQRSSFSNQSCVELASGGNIQDNYIANITVNDSEQIEVEIYQDPLGIDIQYELFRAISGQTFKKVYSFEQKEENYFTYVDPDADPGSLVYNYKMIAFDYCSDTISTSNTSSNINLTAIANTADLRNNLAWNSYAGWDGGVQEYEIYRKTAYEGDFTYLNSVGPEENSYVDDVSENLDEEGLFCYQVVAVEGANSFGNSRRAVSNEGCTSQEPIMWIPNTIVINGHNNVFKPVAGFIDRDNYHMEIFDRWGQRIFGTNDVEKGWDGTLNGNNQRESYYLYIISFNNGAGRNFIRKGEVYILQSQAQ